MGRQLSEEINKIFKDFYDKMYSHSINPTDPNLKNEHIITSLNRETSHGLTKYAQVGMAFLAEFYKTFWPMLATSQTG